MPKQEREIDPHTQAVFEAAMERIKVVTGAYTQVKLAEVLDVRQSSISDAKRRTSIPDGWLVKLYRSHKVHPDWIMYGTGPQNLADTNHAAIASLEERLRLVMEDFARLVSRVEDAIEFINLTDADIKQRKAYHAGVLSVDLEKAKEIHADLKIVAADVAAQTH